MQILRGIVSSYPNLFNISSEPTEGDGGATQSGFSSKWGWIATINNLSNNDRKAWDFFGNMNVTEFLNTVVFYKEHAENEKAKWQAQQT